MPSPSPLSPPLLQQLLLLQLRVGPRTWMCGAGATLVSCEEADNKCPTFPEALGGSPATLYCCINIEHGNPEDTDTDKNLLIKIIWVSGDFQIS